MTCTESLPVAYLSFTFNIIFDYNIILVISSAPKHLGELLIGVRV